MNDWAVTEVIQMTDKIQVKLVHPNQPLAVRMTWDGKKRSYVWDRTGMRVPKRYYSELVRSMFNHFNKPENQPKPSK